VINWNEEKNKWLIRERGISFQEIADIILRGEYLDILENPTRPDQDIFLVRIRGYIWVIPFTIEEDETIFLKTAFPSRKFHKRHGGKDETNTGQV
jgi:uncharacterized DUF497 family protein